MELLATGLGHGSISIPVKMQEVTVLLLYVLPAVESVLNKARGLRLLYERDACITVAQTALIVSLRYLLKPGISGMREKLHPSLMMTQNS